ncbi:MAG: MFS transporter [Candidatus Omnitrophica bacterium]|nr:MFS transporter [Candidatus Omnitrophota bacterium]
MKLNSSFLFRALANRNYRLFFTGQGISLVGTWMQQVAMAWMIYRMSNSAFLLGVVGFAGQIPGFFLTPFAGILADRHDRRKMLVVTQALSMLQASILTVLVFTKQIEIWHIFVLSAFMGIINSFDIPIRQSFTIDMIEKKEDLGNAIALNSSLFNIARLIGPLAAGILIAVAGEGVCFLLNALSYLAVIASLQLMTTTPKEKKASHPHIFHELKEGFVYAFGFMPIRVILLALAMVSLWGTPAQILMPIFAKDIFHGGPQTLGILAAMAGCGALTGAFYLAQRKSVLGLGRVIFVSTLLFGFSVILFSFSRIFWLSLICIFCCGIGMMVQMAACNTILQTIVEENKRGRVMSMFTLAFMGTVPFGSLIGGSLAHTIGAPLTLTFGGVCCILGGLLFARMLPRLKKEIRPIYIEKGIIIT